MCLAVGLFVVFFLYSWCSSLSVLCFCSVMVLSPLSLSLHSHFLSVCSFSSLIPFSTTTLILFDIVSLIHSLWLSPPLPPPPPSISPFYSHLFFNTFPLSLSPNRDDLFLLIKLVLILVVFFHLVFPELSYSVISYYSVFYIHYNIYFVTHLFELFFQRFLYTHTSRYIFYNKFFVIFISTIVTNFVKI